MTPYYDFAGIKIFHADCRECLEWLRGDVLVTDPPYGINYRSHKEGLLARSIAGDDGTGLRDWVIGKWDSRPALIFGTWKRNRPKATKTLLVWDTKGALGMGDLSLPWKPAHQEIYVLGRGFRGRRGSDVLVHAPVQAKAGNGRVHPHEKPTSLLVDLISKCPEGIVVDTFVGSGSTLVAAKLLSRQAIGIEIEERYCEIAARRLSQAVLPWGVPLIADTRITRRNQR